MSGTEMQRAKEAAADIMRQKQAAGSSPLKLSHRMAELVEANTVCAVAEAKRAAEKK